MKPRANILWVPGTNCHEETAHAFALAGAKPCIVLINRLISGKERLCDCDLFGDPGGFGWGDHIRAGWIKSIDLVRRFRDQMAMMVEKQIPMIGICNGFQDFATTGLLNGKLGEPTLLLDMNRSAHFEHWSNAKIVIHDPGDCVWIKGLDGAEMHLPVAHGEGRVVNLVSKQEWDIAANYGSYEGESKYPISPNGSKIAGISRGNIFGLMPHPERRIDKRHGGNEGLLIFKNAVRAVT
ncbi:MAG: hypothetical protein C0410_13710 [Anaerolinea sp.]|nr:hypothetical protein [Anaerolinea sp.]